MGELPLGHQGEQAQQAALIRRRDHNPASGLGEADQLPYERPGVFQVLDRLHGDDRVRGCVGNRYGAPVQVGCYEDPFGGKSSYLTTSTPMYSEKRPSR